jgi:hypothetical protein
MTHLEELTLYLVLSGGSTFVSGTDLNTEILIHLPRLHTFTFYIVSKSNISPDVRICNSDIQRSFTNMDHRQVASMVDYIGPRDLICRIFSLPFKFHRLEYIGNNIPNIVFNSVTHLKLFDRYEFKYEFFVRLTQVFSFLQKLSLWNITPPFRRCREFYLQDIDWCSIVEYPYLISLNIQRAHYYYVEHFLNETKTHLPRLKELKISSNHLETVTKNFTRDETRRNCARVNRLTVDGLIIDSKDVYNYFPLLSLYCCSDTI